MTCEMYNCNERAEYPFPCCSLAHGYQFKSIRENLKAYQNGEPTYYWREGWITMKFLEQLSINELEYYNGK